VEEWELDTPEQEKATSSPGPPKGPAEEGKSPSPPTTAPQAGPGSESEQPRTSARVAGSPEGEPRPDGNRTHARGGHSGRRPSFALQVGVAVVILLVGVMVGFFIARGQTSGDEELLAETRDQLAQLERALEQSEGRNWTYYRANQALRAELEEIQGGGETGSTATSGPGQSSGVYGDGVYIVGEDISPGTYDGVVDQGTGYWARLKATDGSTSAIIANAIVRGPFVLTIYVGDKAVELRGVTITAS
jgi:hypothetical protein